MAREAKCGLMLWDGKSKGTLNNILNLIAAEKRTLVYFAPTRDFHVMASQSRFASTIWPLPRARPRHRGAWARPENSLTQTRLPPSPL
jgi:hypothetical protein